MATAKLRGGGGGLLSQRWEQYDGELEDSDQTIAAVPRAHRQGLVSVSQQFSRERKPPPVKSAFFVETTDEEESRGDLRQERRVDSGTDDGSRRRRVGSRSNAPPSRQYLPLAGAAQGALAVPLPQQQHARLHIDAVQFPVTRSVLWDRRVLAEPIGVSVEQVLPRFRVAADALKQVYRLYQDRVATPFAENDLLCYLCGDAATILSEKHVILTKIAMKQERKDKRDPAVLWVPVRAVVGQRTNKPLQLSQSSYASAINMAHASYMDEKAYAVTSKLQPTLLVAASTVHTVQLDLQLECAAPPVLFKFSLIRNLPLLMTPLASSLSRQEFGSSATTRRSGYLTLDRARKAVPVLKADPLVFQQPIVGLWVYGVPLSEEWNDDTIRKQLADPYLYFACLEYLSSRWIKEKVELTKSTFLVALYPSGNAVDNQSHVSSLPRFFECSFSEHVAPQRPIPMELYAQQKSCLVGVSSFSSDLEFTLCSSPNAEWEQAKEHLGVPITPARREEPQLDAEPEAPSGNEATYESVGATKRSSRVSFGKSRSRGVEIDDKSVFSQSSASKSNESYSENRSSRPQTNENESPNNGSERLPAAAIRTEEEIDEHYHEEAQEFVDPSTSPFEQPETVSDQRRNGSNSSIGSRSCCKSQALLTIQHQQILENQQRQLHEMQEQIAHLRRLLDATKKVGAGDQEEVSVLRSSALEVASTFEDVEQPEEHSFVASRSGSSLRDESRMEDSALQGRRSLRDEPSMEHSELARDEDDDGASFVSSLRLSSISNSSVRSDLSSLSSSLIGKRLKQKSARLGNEDKLYRSRGSAVDSELMEIVSSHGDQQDVNEPRVDLCASRSEKVDASFHSSHHSSNGNEDADHTENSPQSEQVALGGREAAEDDASSVLDGERAKAPESPFEKLLTPDSYLSKKGAFVDHHRGCYTAAPLDMHSFCVPRIKFAGESKSPGGYISDSDDDEEIRLIEQKYRRLLSP
ncbi:Coatomer protein, partial [Globisporangium splendens]